MRRLNIWKSGESVGQEETQNRSKELVIRKRGRPRKVRQEVTSRLITPKEPERL